MHLGKIFNKLVVTLIFSGVLIFSQNASAFYSSESELEELKVSVQEILNFKDRLDAEECKEFARHCGNSASESFRFKNYELALFFANAAIEFNPNDTWHWNQRGIAYKYLKEYEKAISDFNKAIELDPNDSSAYRQLGNLYNDLQNYDKAIYYYNNAIELKPDAESAYKYRGVSYIGLGKYEQAVADFDKALELSPKEVLTVEPTNRNVSSEKNSDIALIYNLRGVAYYYLKKYDAAISDYSKAIELDPDFAGAYNNRGICYQALGETEKSNADFAKADEIENKD